MSELSAVAVGRESTRKGLIDREALSKAPVRRLRVAQLVTSFTARADGITLRGALGLDPARYSTTILAGKGGSFAGRAEEAGLPVIALRHMSPARRVNPWLDAQGMKELAAHLTAGEFDLVHTHSAKAGAFGRMAARRAGVPAIVHSFHGFPFHEFQSSLVRGALLGIERRLARTTDYFLTDGTVVRMLGAAGGARRILAFLPRDAASGTAGIPEEGERP